MIQLVAVIILFTVNLGGVTEASTCGYESCPKGKPDMLNVHLICHTHDDVGWIHTVDTYYAMWVRDIISSVVSNLVHHENRKFIYVETAFFSKWWDQQTDLVKDYVRKLVSDGRLEFANGGWSMNDEATTHYLAIIDQMTLGLRWLNDTFGSCAAPRVGWQVDTFGHSREQASLFSQMHFDGEFVGRIHYQEKFWRRKTRTMEGVWRASESLGEKANLFLGILPNVYWPPKGFCFDVFCADEELSDENIHVRGQKFISLAKEQAAHYGTNHIAMTMGMDFYFRDAAKWYRNLDFLIHHINSLQAVGVNVNIFYSSPACYLHALNRVNKTWPTITADFFPYADRPHDYWTGYFTSRPALKFQARRSSAFLQACKQLMSLTNSSTGNVKSLAKALGVVQHHDGITGTEKQHVADDYSKQLSEGVSHCETIVGNSLEEFIVFFDAEADSDCKKTGIEFCGQLNISQCYFSEIVSEFYLIAYNPFAQEVNTYIRLPVYENGYNVTMTIGHESIMTQIVPIPLSVLNLPERKAIAKNELVFPVTLPPLTAVIYNIYMLDDYEPVNDVESAQISISVQDAVIRNEFYEVKIDGHSGLIKEITLVKYNARFPMKQSFYFYEGMPGYRIEKASGAYAFNPQYDLAFPLGENVTYRVFKGHLVEEVHQYFTPWISQVIRVYKGQPFVEFDWVVGPIPIYDNIGREVITRFDTELNTNSTFFTDSNGRETVKRVRNHQENFPLNATEFVSGNYYPVTAWIYVQDVAQDVQLSILTDRAEGGSSVRDGSVELMVHRRLLFDDGFGVNEALNEGGHDGRGLIVRGKHYLTLGKIAEMKPLIKVLAKQLFYMPVLGFMKQNLSSGPTCNPTFFLPLQRLIILPEKIHLLTLEKLTSDTLLLRLEHFYEKLDYPDDSQPIKISLSELFIPFEVLHYKETTLGANLYLHEVERLKWSYNAGTESLGYGGAVHDYADDNGSDNGSSTILEENFGHNDSDFIIFMKPMEIRTFIITVKYRRFL